MHAAPTLLETQRRFLAALYDDEDAGPVDGIAGNGLEPAARLRIYRHSCCETQIAALRTSYPGVLALVGGAFFDQVARGYRRAYPSCSGNLQRFGADFGDYLGSLSALDAYPYMPDVARLEWRRQASALAAEAKPIAPETVARQLSGVVGPVEIKLHPSVQVLDSRHPVLTIWRYSIAPTLGGLELTGGGEQVVLWREDGEVAMAAPEAASFACIEALTCGKTLGYAHTTAQALDPDFDLPACLDNLAGKGLVVALHPIPRHAEHAP